MIQITLSIIKKEFIFGKLLNFGHCCVPRELCQFEELTSNQSPAATLTHTVTVSLPVVLHFPFCLTL